MKKQNPNIMPAVITATGAILAAVVGVWGVQWNKHEDVKSSWTLQIDDPKYASTSSNLPARIKARSVKVEWRSRQNLVIQVYDFYANGNLLYPQNNSNAMSSAGVIIPELNPGKYQFKAWVPGSNIPSYWAWLEIP